MRHTLLALLATGALIAIAWAQANNSNTWVTTGNQTVGGAVIMCPRASDNVAVPCNNATQGPGVTGNGFPPGAVPITNYTAGVAGVTAATIPAAAGKFSYICGFTITATATAAIFGQATLINTGLTTLGFQQQVFASPAVANLTENFAPCQPSTATNTAITVSSIAAGTGGATNVVVWGYQL